MNRKYRNVRTVDLIGIFHFTFNDRNESFHLFRNNPNRELWYTILRLNEVLGEMKFELQFRKIILNLSGNFQN